MTEAKTQPAYSPKQFNVIGEAFKNFEGTPMHRIAYQSVLRLLGNIAGKSVLDLGCGYGFFTRKLQHLGAARLVGVDISEKMLGLARLYCADAGGERSNFSSKISPKWAF